MRSASSVILGLALAISLDAAAEAAYFKSTPAKDNRVLVTLTGEISDGDVDTFKAAIKSANDAGKFVANIRLNSPGGSLPEGVKLSEVIRFAKISTNVGHGATCASACFLIFAAGQTKFANYTAQIGVHGASDNAGAETMQSSAATVSMARIAKDLGVPAAIIGRMVVTPPTEMVWLSPFDLQSMGTTMVGKPAQVSTAPGAPLKLQTEQGSPSQLQPTDLAKATSDWATLTKKAFAISSAQNGGKPKTLRSCQPEAKACATGVMFKLNDGDAILLAREDLSGKVYKRELCTFNSFGDVRHCVDWDDGSTHRDMKDNRGEWNKIAD